MKQIKCSALSISPDLPLFHAGPSLDLGAHALSVLFFPLGARFFMHPAL